MPGRITPFCPALQVCQNSLGRPRKIGASPAEPIKRLTWQLNLSTQVARGTKNLFGGLSGHCSNAPWAYGKTCQNFWRLITHTAEPLAGAAAGRISLSPLRILFHLASLTLSLNSGVMMKYVHNHCSTPVKQGGILGSIEIAAAWRMHFTIPSPN